MPTLTAKCERCGADFTLSVRPADIRIGAWDAFEAEEWEIESTDCAQGLSCPRIGVFGSSCTVDADTVNRLLDRHPDTQREWELGRREREDAFKEQQAEGRRKP